MRQRIVAQGIHRVTRRRLDRVPRGARHHQAGTGPHRPDRRADPVQPRASRAAPDSSASAPWPACLMIFVGITGALRNQFASPAAGRRALACHAHAGLPGPVRGADPRPVRGPRGEAVLHGLVRALPGRRHGAPSPCAPPRARSSARSPTASPRCWAAPSRIGMEELEASRARVAEGSSALPGYETGAAPARGRRDRHGRPSPRSTPVRVPGVAHDGPRARQRLRGRLPRRHAPAAWPQQPYAADQTARMDMPRRTCRPRRRCRAWTAPRQHLGQLAGPVPAAGRRGASVGVRPATGHRIHHPGLWQFGHRRLSADSDVYDTGETNARPTARTTRTTRTTAVPPTDPSPGASFDAPGSGEPWNTPSGGYR